MLNQLTAGTNTYIYRYDGLGNRVARIENGVEKRYVGGLAETDASGNITAYYVHGLGLISKVTPSNQSYHYHYDGIGSTIAITDSSGNVVNKYAYDSFGKILDQTEAIPNALKYVGQFGVMDEENGLLYMRARYYDPEVGRFISKDPIGFAGGDLNLYAYVQNNPVNWIDPLGLVMQFSVGSSLTIGGSPYIWPALFGGGGMSIGFTTRGQLFIQLQANGMIGAGFFAGVGVQGTVTNSDCNLPTGINSQLYNFHSEANAGWGGAAGYSLDIVKGSQSFGRNFRAGGGYGAMVGTGVSWITTIATPALW